MRIKWKKREEILKKSNLVSYYFYCFHIFCGIIFYRSSKLDIETMNISKNLKEVEIKKYRFIAEILDNAKIIENRNILSTFLSKKFLFYL